MTESHILVTIERVELTFYAPNFVFDPGKNERSDGRHDRRVEKRWNYRSAGQFIREEKGLTARSILSIC